MVKVRGPPPPPGTGHHGLARSPRATGVDDGVGYGLRTVRLAEGTADLVEGLLPGQVERLSIPPSSRRQRRARYCNFFESRARDRRYWRRTPRPASASRAKPERHALRATQEAQEATAGTTGRPHTPRGTELGLSAPHCVHRASQSDAAVSEDHREHQQLGKHDSGDSPRTTATVASSARF